jgi:alpha-1,6-mannosyltransferase
MGASPAGETTAAAARAFWVALGALVAFGLALIPNSDFAQPGAAWRFTLMGFAAGIAWAVAVHRFDAIPARARPWIFWGVAALLRLAMLAAHPADDFWRYLWEGRIQSAGAGLNPYLLEPASLILAPLRTPWWHLINHPDWAAVYPPGAQLLFAGLARLTENPLAWKIAFALFDVAVIALLVRLRRGPGCYRTVAWYAWNPLVLYAFAGAGHYDSAMILALVVAYACLDRALRSAPDPDTVSFAAPLAASVFLGLAISLKAAPLVLLPLFGFALGRRALWLVPGLFIPPALAVLYGFPGVEVFAPLREFALRARTNDAVWWIWELVAGPRPTNTAYNAVLLAACAVLGWVFRREPLRGMLAVLGASMILSPVLHAWYLCWLLPFACLRRSVPWMVFSVSIFGYFLLWESTLFWSPWAQPVWQRLLILLPPVYAIIRSRVRPALPS